MEDISPDPAIELIDHLGHDGVRFETRPTLVTVSR
jgi:hypothetical protein